MGESLGNLGNGPDHAKLLRRNLGRSVRKCLWRCERMIRRELGPREQNVHVGKAYGADGIESVLMWLEIRMTGIIDSAENSFI